MSKSKHSFDFSESWGYFHSDIHGTTDMSAEQLTYSGHAEMTVTEMKAGSIFGNKIKNICQSFRYILEPILNPVSR